MKLPLFLSVCLVALLGRPVQSTAQTLATLSSAMPASLDITLQGPWILYQDNNFIGPDGKTKSPALIVMAPPMTDVDSGYYHQPPVISVGDGYMIGSAGIYCLKFNINSMNQCAPYRAAGSLGPGGYPGTKLVPVMVPEGKNWNWYNLKSGRRTNGTYLILPMPDSMSGNGKWPMEFAKVSDRNSTSTPTGYDTKDVYNIGVTLHYTGLAPTSVSLYQCLLPFTNDSATTCTRPSYHSLDNTGTLHITMKAPELDDACDPHVRVAHREMLLFLDPTSLDPTNAVPVPKNINQKYAFVDPAINYDGYNPVYDDAGWNLGCRVQDDPPNHMHLMHVPGLLALELDPASEAQSQKSDLRVMLYQINDDIVVLSKEFKDNFFSELDSKYKLSPILRVSGRPKEGEDPDLGMPRFALAATLINRSLSSYDGNDKVQRLMIDQRDFLAAYQTQTKGAKDCLAAIMIVNP